MNSKLTMVLELLSAGVIASLVAGIFSVINTVKNNKRLTELENSRQKFTVNQGKYKELKNAYSELLDTLPEEKLLGHIVMNLPAQENFQENGISVALKAADGSVKIIYSHSQKYCYLLSDDGQKGITNLITEIDTLTKGIINITSGLQVYDVDADEDAPTEDVYEKIAQKIRKVAELENLYFDLFRDSLSKFSQ